MGSIYGFVKAWDEERGFGLIEPAQGGRDIQVSLTGFAASGHRSSSASGTRLK